MREGQGVHFTDESVGRGPAMHFEMPGEMPFAMPVATRLSTLFPKPAEKVKRCPLRGEGA